MVAFQGNVTELFNYNASFGNATFCASVVEYHSSITSDLEFLSADFTFYVSLTDSNVFELNIGLDFTFDFLLDQFQLKATSFNHQFIYTSNLTISSLSITESILIMQSDEASQAILYSLNYTMNTTVIDLPANQTFSYFSYNSNASNNDSISQIEEILFLTPTEILGLNFNLSDFTINIGLPILSLPFDRYGIILGTQVSILFGFGSLTVYVSMGSGSGGGGGGWVQCLVDNCLSCFANSNICSMCVTGYTLQNNACLL